MACTPAVEEAATTISLNEEKIPSAKIVGVWGLHKFGLGSCYVCPDVVFGNDGYGAMINPSSTIEPFSWVSINDSTIKISDLTYQDVEIKNSSLIRSGNYVSHFYSDSTRLELELLDVKHEMIYVLSRISPTKVQRVFSFNRHL